MSMDRDSSNSTSEEDFLLSLPWNIVTVDSPNHSNQKYDVYYIALTTCPHCRRGLKWLEDRNINFNWLYLDRLDRALKTQIKSHLKDRFHLQRGMGAPFIIFRSSKDGTEYHSNGYDPEYWKSKI